MRMPTKLRLNSRPWRVSIQGPSKMGDANGWCHYDKSQIHLLAGLDPVLRAETALHELMHAVRHVQGHEYGAEVEEGYVRSLASGLIGAMRDNPEFFLWLFFTANHES